MVIAAHAGTGKTYFAGTVPGSIDFVCMPYKYDLHREDFYPAVGTGMSPARESENCKADLALEMRMEWPFNYIEAILQEHASYRYLIIPPVLPVLRALREEGVPYILCYPEREAKDVYERRYRARGNTEQFIDIFIGGWDRFLDGMASDPGRHHIVMKRHEYLTDLVPRMDKLIACS